MTDYLLDTNAAIAIIKGKPRLVSERLIAVADAGSTIALSTIALYELHYGASKSTNPDKNRSSIDKLLAGAIVVLPFEDEDAAHAGAIRAALKTAGTPIGPYDVLLAGQAIRHGAVLVTANVREFRRVAHLNVEDWSKVV